MKLFKKSIAVLLAAITLLTFSACHKKDEVALNIDGVEITSALYMYALIESDMEAKSKIDSEQSTDSDTTTEIDYYSQKIDELSFVDYVKADAIKRCKKIALFQKLIDEKVITMTEEEKADAEYYAESYWSYYGYSALFETNGVSLDTFKKAFISSYYSDLYFKHIYGEGGEKEVSKEAIKKALNDKYVLVYTLSASYEEDDKDEDKNALKSKYQAYADRLAKGEAYETIYEEINGKQEAEEEDDHTHEESEEDAPKDEYATVIGDEDTSYASDDYNTVDALKVGETKLIENADKTGFTVYKKLDINSDEYYLTALTDDILYVLKNDEYEERITSEIKDLKVEENTYATKRFKVKKIVYPTGQ